MAGESNQVKWRGTLKIYPAIADLDAIEDTIQQVVTGDAVSNVCTLDSVGVTAGKIWIITLISAYNNDGTAGRVRLLKRIAAVDYMLISKITVALRESVDFHGVLILNSGEKIRAYLNAIQGATDTCFLIYNGYQIDKY